MMTLKETIMLFRYRLRNAIKRADDQPGLAKVIIGSSIKALIDEIAGEPVPSMSLGEVDVVARERQTSEHKTPPLMISWNELAPEMRRAIERCKNYLRHLSNFNYRLDVRYGLPKIKQFCDRVDSYPISLSANSFEQFLYLLAKYHPDLVRKHREEIDAYKGGPPFPESNYDVVSDQYTFTPEELSRVVSISQYARLRKERDEARKERDRLKKELNKRRMQRESRRKNRRS